MQDIEDNLLDQFLEEELFECVHPSDLVDYMEDIVAYKSFSFC